MGLGRSLGFYGFLSPPGDSDVQTNLKTTDLDFVRQARMTWPTVAITIGTGTIFFIYIQFFPQQIFLLIMCHTMAGTQIKFIMKCSIIANQGTAGKKLEMRM